MMLATRWIRTKFLSITYARSKYIVKNSFDSFSVLRSQLRSLSETPKNDILEAENHMENLFLEQLKEFHRLEGRPPTDMEHMQIKSMIRLFITVCKGFEEQTGLELSEDALQIINLFTKDARVIEYCSKETEITELLLKRWEIEYETLPEQNDMIEIQKKCHERLKKDEKLYSDMEKAQDEMVEALRKSNELDLEKNRKEAKRREESEKDVEKHQIETVTRARMFMQQSNNREPTAKEIQWALSKSIVPQLHKEASDEKFDKLIAVTEVNPPITGDPDSTAEEIEDITRAWVDKFVVPLKICPHAGSHPLFVTVGGNSVAKKYDPSDSSIPKITADVTLKVLEKQLEVVWKAGERLRLLSADSDDARSSSMLVVLPHLKAYHWAGFVAFTELASLGLRPLGLHALCYHPGAVLTNFPLSVTYYRKRSPWPIVHIMRRDVLYSAGQGKSKVEFEVDLQTRNDRRFRKMGLHRVEEDYRDVVSKKIPLLESPKNRPILRKSRPKTRPRPQIENPV